MKQKQIVLKTAKVYKRSNNSAITWWGILAVAVLTFDMWLSKPLWKNIPFLRAVLPSESAKFTSTDSFEWPQQNDSSEQMILDRLSAFEMPVPPAVADLPQEWRVVRMKVTAYCSCAKCCGKFSDGKTACLHRIRPGDTFVAADKKWPFGTEMIIPGYNNNQPVEVKDRGRLIKGNRLDIYFDSHQQAKKWGSRTLEVLVRTSDFKKRQSFLPAATESKTASDF